MRKVFDKEIFSVQSPKALENETPVPLHNGRHGVSVNANVCRSRMQIRRNIKAHLSKFPERVTMNICLRLPTLSTQKRNACTTTARGGTAFL